MYITVYDPAIEAEQHLRLAEQRFLSVPVGSVRDECASEFLESEAQWQAADEAFANAVPTTCAGALLKIEALLDLARAAGLVEDSLENRHLRSLIAYLSDVADTPLQRRSFASAAASWRKRG